MKDTERKRKVAESQKKKKAKGVLCFFGIFLKLSTVFGAVWGHRDTLLAVVAGVLLPDLVLPKG